MNEEVTKKIIEYLESTKDFFLEQAPDVIKQMIAYESFTCIFAITISGLLFLGVCIFWLYMYKNPNKKDEYCGWNCARCVLPLALLPLFGMLVCSIDNYVKIKMAPKYYIMQKVLNKK